MRIQIALITLVICTIGLSFAAAQPGLVKVTSEEAARRKSLWNRIPTDIKFPAKPVIAEGGGAGGKVKVAIDWKKLISMAELEKEIQIAHTESLDDIKNEGFFKSRGRATAIDHQGIMATMYHVMSEHPDDAKSKAEASGLRDIAAKAQMLAYEEDDGAFAASKASSDTVTKAMKSGKSGVSEGKKEFEMAYDVADFNMLMRRMELAFRKRMYKWSASAPEFIANREALIHDAQVLAVFAQMILDSSYDLAEEGDYIQYTIDMRDAAVAASKGAQENDFDATREAVIIINKRCDRCHGAYR